MVMPTFLLSSATRFLALPSWLHMALIGTLLIGGVQLKHAFEVRKLEKHIAALTEQVVSEHDRVQTLNTALSEMTRNRDNVVSELRIQNERVDALLLAAQAERQAAAIVAIRALQRGREEAESLRAPTSQVPPGHEAMNEYLRKRFEVK